MTLQERIEESERTGKLNVSYMGLTTLPPLPPTLKKLNCYNNFLITLPELPSSLIELVCSGNQLTTLPALPSNLTRLYCYENELITLPRLPPTLTSLYCSHNRLTILPPIPSTLTELFCNDNPYNPLFADLTASKDPILTLHGNIKGVKMYYTNIQKQLRSTLALQRTLGKDARCILNDDCLIIIGSYLSGQSGTLPMQLANLQTILFT